MIYFFVQPAAFDQQRYIYICIILEIYRFFIVKKSYDRPNVSVHLLILNDFSTLSVAPQSYSFLLEIFQNRSRIYAFNLKSFSIFLKQLDNVLLKK